MLPLMCLSALLPSSPEPGAVSSHSCLFPVPLCEPCPNAGPFPKATLLLWDPVEWLLRVGRRALRSERTQ